MTADHAPSEMLVECSRCRGLGRLYGGHDSDPSDYGSCPVCMGSGEMEVEVFPINEADVMEPAYDPATQPYDEPFKHAPGTQDGSALEAARRIASWPADLEIQDPWHAAAVNLARAFLALSRKAEEGE